MDKDKKRDIALWRLSVLGPLISARLDHGDRRDYFQQAAARTHEWLDGSLVEIAARTIESWYYDYKRGGLEALEPQTRKDRGQTRSISTEVAELIIRLKRERPRRSVRRIIRILERARKIGKGELSRSSVHRLLYARGASKRPLRGPPAERRSFMVEHAGDLLVGDALHGPLAIAPDGRLRKAYLLSQIDCATRYVPHSFFAFSEGAVEEENGFKQVILKYGPPRAYYVDRGSAYIAKSLRQICGELAIHLLHTGRQDAEAKGVIERWHRTWREEVGDELPETPLPLAELNAKHWAWLAVEYHARKHDTSGRAPKEHWLSEIEHLRSVPKNKNLDDVFLHRERRKVRKDGTVRFGGRLLEVRAELSSRWVELRFDPHEPAALPRAFVDDRFVCDTVPLDRLKNATRHRRRNLGVPEPGIEPSGLDPLGLIEDEHYRTSRPIPGACAPDPHNPEE
jgi:transposase InsO family protein